LYSNNWELIEKYFDLDSWIDYFILERFSQNLDEGWSSAYIYKTDGDEKLKASSPWDLDFTFGTRPAPSFSEDSMVSNNPNYILTELWKYSEFKHLISSRWSEISNDILNFSINYINEIRNSEKRSYERDFAKWWNNDEWTEHTETFLEQFKRRISFLNSYWIY
jgi:hypothetical protein